MQENFKWRTGTRLQSLYNCLEKATITSRFYEVDTEEYCYLIQYDNNGSIVSYGATTAEAVFLVEWQ